MATAARHRASLPVGVNPWSIEPLIVTSIDYIKRPEVLPGCSRVPVGRRHRRRGASCRRRQRPPRRRRGAVPRCAVRPAAHRHAAQRRPAGVRVAVRPRSSTTTRCSCSAALVRKSATARERRVHQLRVRPSGASAACMRAWTRSFGRFSANTAARIRRHLAGACDAAEARAVERLRAAALRRTPTAVRSASTTRRRSATALPLDDLGGEFDARRRGAAVDHSGASRLATTSETLLTRSLEAAARAVGRRDKTGRPERLLRRMREPAVVFTEYRDTLLHVRDAVAPARASSRRAFARRAARGAGTFRTGGCCSRPTPPAKD